MGQQVELMRDKFLEKINDISIRYKNLKHNFRETYKAEYDKKTRQYSIFNS